MQKNTQKVTLLACTRDAFTPHPLFTAPVAILVRMHTRRFYTTPLVHRTRRYPRTTTRMLPAGTAATRLALPHSSAACERQHSALWRTAQWTHSGTPDSSNAAGHMAATHSIVWVPWVVLGSPGLSSAHVGCPRLSRRKQSVRSCDARDCMGPSP
jgi:hypothetical protein